MIEGKLLLGFGELVLCETAVNLVVEIYPAGITLSNVNWSAKSVLGNFLTREVCLEILLGFDGCEKLLLVGLLLGVDLGGVGVCLLVFENLVVEISASGGKAGEGLRAGLGGDVAEINGGISWRIRRYKPNALRVNSRLILLEVFSGNGIKGSWRRRWNGDLGARGSGSRRRGWQGIAGGVKTEFG